MYALSYNGGMISAIRKSGNSFVVTISREEMVRVGVEVGDPVLVEIRPVQIRPQLAADLRTAVDAEVPLAADGFARLADA